jgi:hypothetical protein
MAAEMPHVTHVPLYRDGKPRITAHAIALFRQVKRLRCASGDWRDGCDACEAWSDAHGELNDELGCFPWHWPCIPRVYARGSVAQRELWDMLEDASRAARRAN